MRLETMVRRLAEKTDTPVLEQVLLGEKPTTELPETCMIWTGATMGAVKRDGPRISRSSRGLQVEFVEEQPYGVVSWQGKRIKVARLIFQLINKPKFEFRMRRQCPNPLCVNPFHYTITEMKPAEPPEEKVPDFEFPSVEEHWPEDELEELIDVMLLEYHPRSWADVQGAEILEGIPEEQIRAMLVKMGKEDLT